MSTETHEPIDIREKGRGADGTPVTLDRRLFMQFLAFGNCTGFRAVDPGIGTGQLPGALYEDVNDPRGVALLVLSEDPEYFVTTLRQFLNRPPFSALTPKPEYTMLGRTYAQGYEPDLEDALLHAAAEPRLRPGIAVGGLVSVAAGRFLRAAFGRRATPHLDGAQRHRPRLRQGGAGPRHPPGLPWAGQERQRFRDRPAGTELYPLSAIVQRMRKTKQTSLHIEHMGPFFVGKVAWQGK